MRRTFICKINFVNFNSELKTHVLNPLEGKNKGVQGTHAIDKVSDPLN